MIRKGRNKVLNKLFRCKLPRDCSSCKFKVEDLYYDGDGQNVQKQDFEQSEDDLDAFEDARERVSSIIIHKFCHKS